MKPLALVGVLLIVLGLAGLALGHFSFTTQKKVVDVGPVTASVAEQHSIAIPDIAGVAAIIAGAVMVVMGQRRSA